jgi:superfamily II DNA or RNA helicase
MEEYKSLLSKDGYILNKKKIGSELINKIKDELTVEPFKFGVSFGIKEKNEFFKVFRETDEYLIVPKFYALEKLGKPEKNTEIKGEEVKINFKGELRDSQKELINQVLPKLEKDNGGLICLGCGGGKCLGKGTEILLYDGSKKKVEDIIIGDLLMGDDSTPRQVLSLARGREMMYKINGTNDCDYIVNESHILSLKYSKYINNNDVLDISVKDYLNILNNQDNKSIFYNYKEDIFYDYKDNIFYGYRVPITFQEKDIEVEPYLLGYWLGNKQSKYSLIKIVGINYKFIKFLTKYNLLKNKYIPHHYKCNSRDIQLKLLAGIIDSTGYYYNYCYTIIQKNEKLLDDIIFLSRSLGFCAFKKIRNNYFLTTIYGNGIEEIPVLNLIKKAKHKVYTEDTLNYEIKLEKLQEDDYYGFEIDGNRRFVLGDFTVTHNTVIALNIASLFQVKTLIVVHKGFLLNQWKERIEQFTDSPIGIIQQNKVDIDGKHFVIGMLQSIAKDKYDSNIFADFGLVIFDEAHHAPSKYFSRALPLINCKKTLALSATPKRSDKLEKVLHWYFGPIIYQYNLEENKTVLTRIYKYNLIHEKFVEKKQRFTGEVNRPGTITNLVTIGRRNRFIIDLVEELLIEEGRKFIILSERVEHLELLKKRLDDRNLCTSGFYIGGMKQKKLDETSQCQIIFGTFQMASEALDIKGLNTLIMATPRREIEQTIGRITRDPNSKIRPIVIDVLDNLESFIRQGYYRRNFYRKNGYQIMFAEVEDNNIIKENDITIVHDVCETTVSKVNNEDIDFIDDE